MTMPLQMEGQWQAHGTIVHPLISPATSWGQNAFVSGTCEFTLRRSRSCYRARELLPTHGLYSFTLALWKFCLRDVLFFVGGGRGSSRIIKVDTLNLAFQKKNQFFTLCQNVLLDREDTLKLLVGKLGTTYHH